MMNTKTTAALIYDEDEVKAVCFYTGIALEAKKRGVIPKELFLIKYPNAEAATGGYGEVAKLYNEGESLSMAGALLLLSPKFNNDSSEEEIAEWIALLERQGNSPVVKMVLSTSSVVSNLGKFFNASYYLAALAQNSP